MKISTGFKDLDKELEGGFNHPSLIVVGSRPAMGKTSFLFDLTKSFDKQDLGFCYMNLESDSREILKKKKMEFHEEHCSSWKKNFNVDEIIEMIEKNKDHEKIVLIDYIQLIQTNYKKDLYEEYSEIINKLKRCSIKNDVTIIVSSQLNRKCEERQGKRPILTDLRGSGELEEASDLVLFIFRANYYDSIDKPKEAEILIAKNRYGSQARVKLKFDKEIATFSDYQEEKNNGKWFSDFEPINAEEKVFSRFDPN